MRIESSVTAVSWIPSDAIEGMPKIPFELGIGHYDEPPPDRLEPGDLEQLRDDDRFREANFLRAWIEVEDGKVVDHGHEGGGLVGFTTFRVGPKNVVVPGVAFEILRPEPEVSADAVRFVQTVGGRAGFPAPRRVSGKPFFRIHSATAWTTLGLTIRADGSSEHELDETLVEQGESGDELYLLLDGVLAVEVDGEEVAEIGPGAILGELAALEASKRTATLRARTRCRVGVVPADLIDRAALEKLAAGRRRER